jgi:hypothetical protein
MNKAWADLYEVLKIFEAKLMVKEGELVLRESNLKGREEVIVARELNKTGTNENLKSTLEMKEKQLKQFRREISINETVLADQFKLIQQEKKDKMEVEQKLHQLNFDLKTKDLLLEDLQKKMVYNSVSLSREISELNIRLSVEKQSNETRKRKASTSAFGPDYSSEAKVCQT